MFCPNQRNLRILGMIFTLFLVVRAQLLLSFSESVTPQGEHLCLHCLLLLFACSMPLIFGSLVLFLGKPRLTLPVIWIGCLYIGSIIVQHIFLPSSYTWFQEIESFTAYVVTPLIIFLQTKVVARKILQKPNPYELNPADYQHP